MATSGKWALVGNMQNNELSAWQVMQILRIQVCPKKGISLTIYSGDGIQTINPTLGMGLDC